jgi:hypothetical protein
VALDGPFLFSANSPSKSVSRYAVYGRKIVQDAPVVAQFTGSPTDIAARDGLAAVVDAAGGQSRVSIFEVDEDGNFTLRGVAALGATPANGVAIVDGDARRWRAKTPPAPACRGPAYHRRPARDPRRRT